MAANHWAFSRRRVKDGDDWRNSKPIVSQSFNPKHGVEGVCAMTMEVMNVNGMPSITIAAERSTVEQTPSDDVAHKIFTGVLTGFATAAGAALFNAMMKPSSRRRSR